MPPSNCRPLTCDGCRLAFPYGREADGTPWLAFLHKTRPPSPRCGPLASTSLCRFHVVRQRAEAAAVLQPMWDAADEVAWVTVFIPGRQLTLSDAMHLNPAEEARFAKRLVLKALASLPNGERDQVRGFGVVEPGVMEIREGGESTTTLVAMHLHLLVWRLSVKRVHDLLHKYAVKTDEVTVPLRVTAAPTPAAPFE